MNPDHSIVAAAGAVEPVTPVDAPPAAATRPIRVLHCIHTLSGGGAERQLTLLLGASARHGMTAAVCCLAPAGVSLPGVALYTRPRRYRYDPIAFALVRDAVEHFRPDLVHAWLPPSTTIPAMLVGRAKRIPVVFSYRSAMRFRRPLAVAEFAVAQACAAGIVANSPAGNADAWYRGLFRRKRGAVIPNAVALPAGARKQTYRQRGDGPLRLLFVGRLTAAKNWSCLIRAMALIDGRIDWRLDLCGDGEDRDQAERLVASLALAGRVRFLGLREDALAEMRRADLLLLPSLWEGMPNALIEAFAVGLPCIASDIPAHRWLTEGTDCLAWFDPQSPASLADAIAGVADHYDAAVARTAAARAVAQRLDLDSMARRYLGYYRLKLGPGAG